jgi:hypothetical protein
VLLSPGCSAGTLDPAVSLARAAGRRVHLLSADERREYLRRARLFDDVDPRLHDLLAGPPDAHHFVFDARVGCDFIEPRNDRVPARGTTPKFFCTLRHGRHDDVKVKYGRSDREVYGEMLGSRLLWALGLAVDRDYAVRVHCHGCPRDPWATYRAFPHPDASPRATTEIDDAVLQELYSGVILEERADQGWRLDELDLVDEADGGAPRVEVDAFRLLAAFIAHGDDKPENQRLVCPFAAVDAQGRCDAPRLLVADLGSTFGRGANGWGLIDAQSRADFAAWSALPVWQDRAACRVHLATRTSRPNPVVSEAGRAFLAARLSALSRAQLVQLFTAARIERLGDTWRAPDGRTRPVTIDDWVAAFERRRAEIVDARCR